MSEASDVDIRICLSADEQGPVHALVGKGYGLSNGKMERLTLYADAIVPSRMDDTCEQVDIKTPYKWKYRFYGWVYEKVQEVPV